VFWIFGGLIETVAISKEILIGSHSTPPSGRFLGPSNGISTDQGSMYLNQFLVCEGDMECKSSKAPFFFDGTNNPYKKVWMFAYLHTMNLKVWEIC
jgi:hypothetical protein